VISSISKADRLRDFLVHDEHNLESTVASSAVTGRFRCPVDVSYRQRERHHEQREYRVTPEDIQVRNQDRLIQDDPTDLSNGLPLCSYQRRILGHKELRHAFEGVLITGRRRYCGFDE
jgi:hypothetical protein